jgi:hypothetical protein
MRGLRPHYASSLSRQEYIHCIYLPCPNPLSMWHMNNAVRELDFSLSWDVQDHSTPAAPTSIRRVHFYRSALAAHRIDRDNVRPMSAGAGDQ